MSGLWHERLRSNRRRVAATCLALLAVYPGSGGLAGELVIDFSRTSGRIRPLHGVNLGPLCYRGMVDLSAHHREIGVPFTRLHDVVWLNAEAVDVHTIFRDFRNDPEKPESYSFAATDDYIQAIIDVGSGVIYRLGESIEHTRRQYFVQPPPDHRRWAAVCAGIIRHYNEGWADGFQHGIRYWEIWNEPDVRPQMWTGTDEEFLTLFEVTAKTIKARFPDVRVGGPGMGHSGDLVGDDFRPTPFTAKFLDFCRDRQVPLDFYSWHRYTADPWDISRRAQGIRRLLDSRGLTRTESHFNEWNYLPRDDWSPMAVSGAGEKREQWFAEMGGPRGAAFAAAVLMSLQDCPVEVANYYTGEIQGFGLFTFHGTPRKTYYAFKAFRQLLSCPVRVATPEGGPGRWILCAGRSEDRTAAAILASNFDAPGSRLAVTPTGLPWAGASRLEVLKLDRETDLLPCQSGSLEEGQSLKLDGVEAPVVLLIKLQPGLGLPREPMKP
ncbi:MAG TPA: hypothetical protein PKY77_09325 [Phycisphaerae bacterium]|nr:hypothetical protein [Phycisphaerae bacterium]HRY68638.1 hypothetical protein [Phycisphaerae bacterium]HSA25464.1 hypothetical protein [Phycisphaerae bacterium]